MVYRMLEQRCREWRKLLYISTVNSKKAFDRIRHQSLWASLAHFGIEMPYIDLLKRLYAEQRGTVMPDKESDPFEMKKRHEAGRSPVQLTVQYGAAIRIGRRPQKMAGVNRGKHLGARREDCLTNQRFVDDARFLHVAEQAEGHAAGFQEMYRESWIGKSPRQDENPQ